MMFPEFSVHCTGSNRRSKTSVKIVVFCRNLRWRGNIICDIFNTNNRILTNNISNDVELDPSND